jgi:hypothetical protein
MLKHVKIMALPLILAAILMVLVFPGCGGNGGGPEGTAAGELTKQELQGLWDDSLLAVENADTYAFSMDMDIDAEVKGGPDAGNMRISMRADGVLDKADEEMQMDFDMSLEGDIEGLEGGSQEISAEMYMLDDWLYMKMKMTGMDEQWIKMPATEDMMGTFSMDMVDQQLAPLESMVDIEFVKYESVGDSQCYVLKIVPDVAGMKEWLEEQEMTAGTGEWDELTEDMFKELDYRLWVTKDTKQLRKLKMTMSVEMTAEQAGVSEFEFDTMTMDIELEMTMKDYNKSVSITLPDEAEDAIEM